MSYLIAAAGTGGHVFPGLAVGEALVELGVGQEEVLFVGGDRLEREVYPAAGFPFLRTEIVGLKRELALSNLRLPAVISRAAAKVSTAITERAITVVLGMGGYVTVPVAVAARRRRASLFVAEQNASGGIANRFAARIAERVFGSFPRTRGLPRAEWIGNPIRKPLRSFDREGLRSVARAGYGLGADGQVVGVIGGSLGAGALNEAAARLAASSPDFSILNLSGKAQFELQSTRARASSIRWVVHDFEPRIELFYAAADVVVARAGGAVAELTATATPAVLIPGGFGSGGHQAANAEALVSAGAGLSVDEDALERVPAMVRQVLAPETHARMTAASRALARPNAALDVAAALVSRHQARQ